MSHDHHHHLPHDHTTKNISAAFWLNTGFAVLEIIGGIYTNSVAILSDALHDLGDSLSLGLSWFFQKKSQQKRDPAFSYGYRRFSLLGAFINSIVLIIGSVFILQEAISRLQAPETPNAKGMIILAIAGVAVNGAAFFRLKKGSSINERVVSLHFLEDILGWTAVLLGSIVMLFVDVPILDPILSVAIALYILSNVYKNLRSVLRVVLQGMPENVDEEDIRKKVSGIEGVQGVHDIHAWSLDGQYNILTMHVVVGDQATLQDTEKIKEDARHCLKHLHLNHITIETENTRANCGLENC